MLCIVLFINHILLSIFIIQNSGRFEVGKKICLNATGYHPDQWKPSWSVKTLLIALSSFMVTEGEGAVGSVDIPAEKRKELAQKSRNYTCSVCGMSHETLYKKWDKKKETDDDDEDDRGKDEMTKSPDETQGTSEEPSTQQTTAEDSAAQPQEKLNPMEILRRRRASRMKQKATEASSKEVEDENRTEQDSGNQGTEENGERGNGREILHDGNNAPADGEGSELVLAPEETIRNAILDKTIVLIILAIIILALRKWLFSLNKNE